MMPIRLHPSTLQKSSQIRWGNDESRIEVILKNEFDRLYLFCVQTGEGKHPFFDPKTKCRGIIDADDALRPLIIIEDKGTLSIEDNGLLALGKGGPSCFIRLDMNGYHINRGSLHSRRNVTEEELQAIQAVARAIDSVTPAPGNDA